MSNREHREWLRRNLGVSHPALDNENDQGNGTASAGQPGAGQVAKQGRAGKDGTAARRGRAAAGAGRGGAPQGGRRSGGSPGRDATVYDFEESEVEPITVPVAPIGIQGNSGEQEIDRYMQKVKHDIDLMMTSFDRALANFDDTLHGASEQDTVPHGANAVMKSLARSAFEAAIEQAVKRIPGIGEAASHLIGPVKGAIEAYISEIDRASDAAARLQTRRFITSLRNVIDAQQRVMYTAVDQTESQLCEEFRSRSGAAGGQQNVAPRAVVGGAADCVNLAKQLAQEFDSRAGRCNVNFFQQQITLGFVNTPGYTHEGRAMLGARQAGMLWLELRLRLRGSFPDNCRWEIEDAARAWTLVTLRSEQDARTAADSLRESFGNTRPWQIPLPHKVVIHVRADTRDFEGQGNVQFADANDFENAAIDAFSVPANVLRSAWADPQVRRRVQSVTGIEGSNE